jgi:hypothetical protein
LPRRRGSSMTATWEARVWPVAGQRRCPCQTHTRVPIAGQTPQVTGQRPGQLPWAQLQEWAARLRTGRNQSQRHSGRCDGRPGQHRNGWGTASGALLRGLKGFSQASKKQNRSDHRISTTAPLGTKRSRGGWDNTRIGGRHEQTPASCAACAKQRHALCSKGACACRAEAATAIQGPLAKVVKANAGKGKGGQARHAERVDAQPG